MIVSHRCFCHIFNCHQNQKMHLTLVYQVNRCKLVTKYIDSNLMSINFKLTLLSSVKNKIFFSLMTLPVLSHLKNLKNNQLSEKIQLSLLSRTIKIQNWTKKSTVSQSWNWDIVKRIKLLICKSLRRKLLKNKKFWAQKTISFGSQNLRSFLLE